VIDRCPVDASAVRRMLPQATLAVDVFHVVQLATTMLSDVRRRAIQEKHGRRGRSGDPEYGVRNLLLRNLEHRHPDQFTKIIDTLDGDREDQQILTWPPGIATEKLRDLIRLRPRIPGTTPTPGRIRQHLFEFVTCCTDYATSPSCSPWPTPSTAGATRSSPPS